MSRSALLALALASGAVTVAAGILTVALIGVAEDPRFWAGRR